MKKKILITTALIYSNGPLHLGHILEHIQADILVQYYKLINNKCITISGCDAHGTPIMLLSNKYNKKTEDIISHFFYKNKKDLMDFNIIYDNFYTTNSYENKKITNKLFKKIKQQNNLEIKYIKQPYDNTKKIFLPDRYIKGTCPKCNQGDQYGDNCVNCGQSYNSINLKNKISSLSNTKPIIKKTKHFFFKISKFKKNIKKWLKTANLQKEIINKSQEWFKNKLKNWDITRDKPYFGFNIPGEKNKYFYVWFDALLGYISILKNLKKNYINIWNKNNNEYKIYHFIGKDIIYFHTLFWPCMLINNNMKLPDGIFVHGFLTINNKKISKSKNNVITARKYLDNLNPEFIRYFFSTKLNNKVDDINLDMNEFMNKINNELINKYMNIAKRCSNIINTKHNNVLYKKINNIQLYKYFIKKGEIISKNYEKLLYSQNINIIILLIDKINQYITNNKPWDNINSQSICTLSINLFKIISIYIKPIIPNIIKQIELFLKIKQLNWYNYKKPLLNHKINNFVNIVEKINIEQINNIYK